MYRRQRQWPWYLLQIVTFFATLCSIWYWLGFETGFAPALVALVMTSLVTKIADMLFGPRSSPLSANQNQFKHNSPSLLRTGGHLSDRPELAPGSRIDQEIRYLLGTGPKPPAIERLLDSRRKL